MSSYKIQFCENNFAHGTDELVQKLETELDYTDIEIEVESCLGVCDDCVAAPFAIINGDMIQSDTADELYEEIKAYIE